MKSLKAMLIFEILVLIASIMLFAQATYAYFTATTSAKVTITSGEVKILLSEAAVKRDADGNLIEDTASARIFGSSAGAVHDYGAVHPGMSIYKDPTIQNIGRNDAYVAAKITVTDGAGDIHRVIGFEYFDDIDITMLLGGGVFDEGAHYGTWNGLENVTYNDRFAYVQVPHRAEGKYDIYFFILDPLVYGEAVTLFDSMVFPTDFTGTDMDEFRDLRIDIYGFGVQTYGFASCYEAMLGALPEHFADFVQPAP